MLTRHSIKERVHTVFVIAVVPSCKVAGKFRDKKKKKKKCETVVSMVKGFPFCYDAFAGGLGPVCVFVFSKKKPSFFHILFYCFEFFFFFYSYFLWSVPPSSHLFEF